MEYIYTFFVAFFMIFVSELGDKTQLLVMSFSSKAKTTKILFGIALGSILSHGIAILFGSSIGILENQTFQNILKFVTYLSFIIIGLISLLPKKEKLTMEGEKKESLIYRLSNLKLHYSVVVALCIMIGELGDKTFLASIGLGIQYPNAKFFLVLGAVSAMVLCNLIAIILGKVLNKYISERFMQKLSGILFLIFGISGFIIH